MRYCSITALVLELPAVKVENMEKRPFKFEDQRNKIKIEISTVRKSRTSLATETFNISFDRYRDYRVFMPKLKSKSNTIYIFYQRIMNICVPKVKGACCPATRLQVARTLKYLQDHDKFRKFIQYELM